jgi:hypothetical protein
MAFNDLRGNDFPATFGDGNGSLIDWSGVTGIWLCYTCNETGGPYYQLDETKAEATNHRAKEHTVMRGGNYVSTVPAEAKAKSKPGLCAWCNEKRAYSRGHCNTCVLRATKAWLVEQGLMGEAEGLQTYLAEIAGKRPVPKKKPTVLPNARTDGQCSWEDCEKAEVTRGLCRGHYNAAYAAGIITRVVRHTICTVDGCAIDTYAKNLCSRHYREARRAEGKRS